MPILTPAERRGASMVVLLIALGAAWDQWQATHPRFVDPNDVPPVVAAVGPADSGPTAPGHGPAAGIPVPDTSRAGPRVDVNRADLVALDRLPGIGPVLARRIVEHRVRNGPFHRVEDLLAVPGIGPRLLERLRPLVTCGAPASR